MNKKKYELPFINVLLIDSEDIILNSGFEKGGIIDFDDGPFEEV